MTSLNPSVTLSDQYARFGLSLQLRDVPRAVQTRAKHLILDAVGIAIASRGYTYAGVSLAAFSELIRLRIKLRAGQIFFRGFAVDCPKNRPETA